MNVRATPPVPGWRGAELAARSGRSSVANTSATDASMAIRETVVATLAVARRVVLAVSGGLDSMVLLEAAARWARASLAGVATFDHRTGPAASAATRLVAERARALGLRVVAGSAAAPARDEAGWRRQRWEFLRGVSRQLDAVVATAHTRDDQVETVFMRALRDAGARGLAGLRAPSPVLRPLLPLSRDTLARFARDQRVRFVEDPSNASRAHLRNRVRLDILPAILRVRPRFADELVDVGERAAALRAEVDALARRLAVLDPEAGELRVAVDALSALEAEGLAIVWPALAALRGVILDWRGTRRVAAFTKRSRRGASMQLSGRVEVVRRRDEFVLRPLLDHTSASASAGRAELVRFDGGESRVGRWRFVPAPEREKTVAGDLWVARLPLDAVVTARAWRPGDRVRGDEGVAARRVKRFFKDARIAGVDRTSWPVVLLGDDVIWIPGVRRTAAATVPSGRPGLCYVCLRQSERHDS